MKTAAKNSCKNFERDQTVGSKFTALLRRYSSLADQTSSSPSSDSKTTKRNTASGNSCKNLKAIQRFWSKVMTLLTRYSRLADQTSSSSNRESKATLRKTASRNSCRYFSAMQRSFQKLWLFWLVSQVLPTRPPRHLVAIPQQPHWKQPPQTLVKIWARSNGRNKIYGYFGTLPKSSRPDLLFTK